ncbi:hypothetical protein BT96DRAFT_941397 [Gymnopus androsaceus JB14]|uniref:Uncharacterized protein n=1 Tax=Gymnopus androsaceus JB14 TaxID=1447944 RepID=A0A6A4HGP6_9AGAR|nr:hypothetical protein BT96DRAFT_941397 [Gymnopus androsaceus JB14]
MNLDLWNKLHLRRRTGLDPSPPTDRNRRPPNGPSPTPNQSQPQSRSASQASQASNRDQPTPTQSRSPSQTQGNPSHSRPASQASNKSRPASVSQPKSRTSSPSVSASRAPRTPRSRSQTSRSISGLDDEDKEPPAPELPHVSEEREERDAKAGGANSLDADNAQPQPTAESKDTGGEKKKRRRRGKKSLKSFGVDKWPHGDNPGKMEPPHGVDDWPYGDPDDSDGVGVSGRVLKRPKGIRDFSPAYAPSESNASTNNSRWTDRTDYSQVSGLALKDWHRDSSLPGVDNWPHGDNPGIMIKPLDHWGKPLTNPDGTLVQRENPTGLPTYNELHGMDLDTHDDHVIKLKLELDIDVAVEINARIRGDVTLALL